jgi:hypothetical protein
MPACRWRGRTVLDRAAQQRLGQRAAAPERQRGLQLGLEVDRLVDLQDLRQVAAPVPVAEIPGAPHASQRVVPR